MCMHARTHTHTHTHKHTHTHSHVHTRSLSHTHTHTRMCARTRTHATHTHIHTLSVGQLEADRFWVNLKDESMFGSFSFYILCKLFASVQVVSTAVSALKADCACVTKNIHGTAHDRYRVSALLSKQPDGIMPTGKWDGGEPVQCQGKSNGYKHSLLDSNGEYLMRGANMLSCTAIVV